MNDYRIMGHLYHQHDTGTVN